MVGDEVADAEQRRRQERQVGLPIEQRLDLRHDEAHQEHHDRYAGQHQHARVDHRPDDLVAQLILTLGENGDPRQDIFEKTALFAGVDHRNGQRLERIGMLAHRLG